MRWTKSDESTEDITVILDFDIELFGQNGEFAYLGKTARGKTSVLSGFLKGETIQALTSAGALTGKVYRLQREIENDGSMMTIEIHT